MDQGKFHSEFICHCSHADDGSEDVQERKKDKYAPFRPAGIGTDYDRILPSIDMLFDICYHQRLRPEIVNWNVEETLNLTSMQVHSNDMIAARHGDHVRHKFSGDRSARLFFLVHPRVRKARYDGRYSACRCGSARRDEDEKFHEIVICITATRLNDEYVFIANRFGDLDVDLPVGEFLDCAWSERIIEPAS